MRDNWIGLLLFGTGILAGVVLIAMLPGMPWSASQGVLALPKPMDAHDLDAQRSMAAAAWYMVAITVLSASAGLYGLVLLHRTLIAARDSADAARSAVAQTAVAIKQAKDDAAAAVQSAEKMARAQLRAYTAIVEASIIFELTELDLQLSVEYVNSGQSPARSLSVAGEIDITPTGKPAQTFPIQDYLLDLPAGRHETANLRLIDLTVDDVMALVMSGGRPAGVRLTLRLKYRDVFSRWRDDEFKFRGVIEQGDLPTLKLKRQPNSLSRSMLSDDADDL